MMSPRPGQFILTWVAAGVAACSISDDSVAREAGPEVDEQAILSSLVDFRESPAFVPVNQNVYESALGTGAAINVFVAAHAFDSYSQIDADASGSGATVPEDTLLIREVLDKPGGKVTTLTLMYKGPPGYNPDLADFWFGVTDPEGAAIEEDGARKTGRLQECYSCHLSRAEDGYLFGVPASNRPDVTPPDDPPPADEPPAEEPPAPAEPVCGDFSCVVGENCAICEFDCQACPPEDEEDDDDHGGDDDDDDGGDDDHGGGGDDDDRDDDD
jgi:hypothetical protein